VDVALVVHENVDFSRCERLPVANVGQNIEEGWILLPMDLVEGNVLEASLHPTSRLERPHLVAVLDVAMFCTSPHFRNVPASLASDGHDKLALLTAMEAVLVWFHWWQLTEVAKDDDLHTAKRFFGLITGGPCQLIHSIKCVA
jgi:hypothetical protein